MDYRDNRQRWAESHQVVHFYAGQWCTFTPALTPEVAEQYLQRAIIHLVFANLKTWLIGIHHGVSHQHLQAYLNEFTFRFNRRFYPFNAFRSLLGIAGRTPLLQPMPSFTRESGGTLHVAVMGVNRIGKNCTMTSRDGAR